MLLHNMRAGTEPGTHSPRPKRDPARKLNNYIMEEKKATPGNAKLEREALPIFAHRDEIVNMIKDNLVRLPNSKPQFCIVTGETGSGKTTQVPQFVFDFISPKDLRTRSSSLFARYYDKNQAFRKSAIEILGASALKLEEAKSPSHEDHKLNLVITQPRRVAAIQISRRVASERSQELGREVGYAIRFEDCVGTETRIKYVTDGILVRECLEDRDLGKYNVVILDEAHERSLHTDILFALVKQAVIRRKGALHLIITSATLEIEKFSRYFYDCPVISVSGRCYDVAVLHGTCQKEKRVENSVKAALRIHMTEGRGDILVFLTGFEECEHAVQLCYEKLEKLKSMGKKVPSMMIVPLYGAMQSEEQAMAFEKTPPDCRKVSPFLHRVG